MKGERITREQRLELRRKALEYCKDCVKLNNDKCMVLKELFHTWSMDKDCWAKETDPVKYLQSLEQIENYNSIAGANYQSKWIEEEKLRMNNLIRAKEEEKKEKAYEDLKQVYMEEVNRKNVKKGGGESNKDGSAFGPQQMKDNRFQYRKQNPEKWNEWY